MNRLLLQPTKIAQWHALVNDAQLSCALQLGEELESYLVFLLLRFSEKPEVTKSILALEFLESLQTAGSRRSEMLRDVGDKCLLYSGFFPEQAKRRRLKESYFIDLGQNAYHELASFSEIQWAQLYNSVCIEFVAMRDVLHAMRDHSINKHDIDPRYLAFVTKH